MAVVEEAAPALAGWLTTGEASRRLGMSPQWTRIMVARGTLRATPTALGLLFDPSSVDELRRARGAGSRATAVEV